MQNMKALLIMNNNLVMNVKGSNRPSSQFLKVRQIILTPVKYRFSMINFTLSI